MDEIDKGQNRQMDEIDLMDLIDNGHNGDAMTDHFVDYRLGPLGRLRPFVDFVHLSIKLSTKKLQTDKFRCLYINEMD